jgi:DNA mismatch endonuclease (patch repair protein)
MLKFAPADKPDYRIDRLGDYFTWKRLVRTTLIKQRERQHNRRGGGSDIFSPAERSRLMSLIRRQDTKPEVLVRQVLRSLGYRFRKNVSSLPGTPDLVLPKQRIAIFVNGCFWHGHSCAKGKPPSQNSRFWISKIESNRKRDRRQARRMRSLGWRVIVLWECQLNNPAKLRQRMSRVVSGVATGVN